MPGGALAFFLSAIDAGRSVYLPASMAWRNVSGAGLRADYSGCRSRNTRELVRVFSSLPQFNFSERTASTSLEDQSKYRILVETVGEGNARGQKMDSLQKRNWPRGCRGPVEAIAVRRNENSSIERHITSITCRIL